VATRDQFINAIAYLIRRLDENTAEENFLRHSFDLKTDSDQWAFLKNQFLAAFAHQELAGKTPNRIQDRGREVFPEKTGTFFTHEFTNEPDTDWAVTANRRWADGIRRRWRKSADDAALEIPLVLAGREVSAGRELREIIDPSQYTESAGIRIGVARYALATAEDVSQAVAVSPRPIPTDGAANRPPSATRCYPRWPWPCAALAPISWARRQPTPARFSPSPTPRSPRRSTLPTSIP
jgi:RHH-type proline utilization regulon transcriptional repressor/proline dehydrogenase/delta 1-pyrroline-5-carboxylate dehydrogenase